VWERVVSCCLLFCQPEAKALRVTQNRPRRGGLFSSGRAPLTTLSRRPASPIDNIAPLQFSFKTV
jgi:hypothetical protein